MDDSLFGVEMHVPPPHEKRHPVAPAVRVRFCVQLGGGVAPPFVVRSEEPSAGRTSEEERGRERKRRGRERKRRGRGGEEETKRRGRGHMY